MPKAEVVVRYETGPNQYDEKSYTVEACDITHAQELALAKAKAEFNPKHRPLLLHDHIVDEKGQPRSIDMWVHSASIA